jgi:hypothetical protein
MSLGYGQYRIVERPRIDTNRPHRVERPKPKIDSGAFAWGVSFLTFCDDNR